MANTFFDEYLSDSFFDKYGTTITTNKERNNALQLLYTFLEYKATAEDCYYFIKNIEKFLILPVKYSLSEKNSYYTHIAKQHSQNWVKVIYPNIAAAIVKNKNIKEKDSCYSKEAILNEVALGYRRDYPRTAMSLSLHTALLYEKLTKDEVMLFYNSAYLNSGIVVQFNSILNRMSLKPDCNERRFLINAVCGLIKNSSDLNNMCKIKEVIKKIGLTEEEIVEIKDIIFAKCIE